MSIGRSDKIDIAAQCDLHQRVVADRIKRMAVVPELDREIVATKSVGQQCQLIGCRCRTVMFERRYNGAFAATREHQPVIAIGRRRGGATKRTQFGE